VERAAGGRAATVDQALRMLKDGQRLAVHDEPERVDILFLDPGQEPPLGQDWTVYGPQRGPWLTPGLIKIVGGDLARPLPPAELVMPLDIMVTVPADSVALPNIGGPAQASIMWARAPIWSGPATLDLRFESDLHDVTELGDRTTRYEQETRGIGTLWLALDPKTAARVLEYVGRGIDHPVMLCVVWAGLPVQFGASLADKPDGAVEPPASHLGEGRAWHGYTIAVDKYPDAAALVFTERNQASARPRED